MQTKLECGRAASGVRSVSRFAILAGVPLIAALALSASGPALAGSCATGRPAVAHAAGGGGSVHTSTGIAAPSGGGGGGGGGCANGSSGSPLRSLPMASSGRVIEAGAAHGAHAAMRPRNATSSNAAAHVHAVRMPHRA